MHAVAAEYPHSTLNGTLASSSNSGTACKYDTHVASQEEFGCVQKTTPEIVYDGT